VVTHYQLLKSLGFRASTPASEVSGLLKKGFFCDADPFVIPSNVGMTYSINVYLPYKEMETYVSLPIIPNQILSQVEDFFDALMEQRLIFELNFKLMLDSLRSSIFGEDQFVELLQWFMNAYKDKELSSDIKKFRRNFMESVNFSTEKQILLLSNVKYFADKVILKKLQLLKKIGL
jgi:hypothetical protein